MPQLSTAAWSLRKDLVHSSSKTVGQSDPIERQRTACGANTMPQHPLHSNIKHHQHQHVQTPCASQSMRARCTARTSAVLHGPHTQVLIDLPPPTGPCKASTKQQEAHAGCVFVCMLACQKGGRDVGARAWLLHLRLCVFTIRLGAEVWGVCSRRVCLCCSHEALFSYSTAPGGQRVQQRIQPTAQLPAGAPVYLVQQQLCQPAGNHGGLRLITR